VPAGLLAPGAAPGPAQHTALDVLHVTRDGLDTLMTFGEFEPVLDRHDAADVRSGPGPARDLFADFDPATRPVLWRVMVIQVLLYWCYQETVFGGLPDLARLEQQFTASDTYATLRATLADRPDAPECESLATTTQAAAAYIRDRVAPGLQRVRRLSLAQAQPTPPRRQSSRRRTAAEPFPAGAGTPPRLGRPRRRRS
jgi:hypothetical protein